MRDGSMAETSAELERRVDETISEVRASARPRVFVISGPSGVGKDTVIDLLRQRLGDVHFAVTATTRPRRPGEIDGVHYLFMSVDEFERNREADDFLECAEVYGNWYGVPRSGIRSAIRSGRHVVVKVDVQGAATIRRLVGGTTSIFLMPASIEELARRLWARKTEEPSVVMRRVRTASREVAAVEEFDYVVFNEEGRLDATMEQILAIVQAERLRVHQPDIAL